MLGGGDLAARQRIAFRHRREHAAFVFLGGIVGVLAIQLEEAVEGDDGAGGAESGAMAVGDFDRDLVEFGGLHLRGDGALPDQLVKAALIIGEEAGDAVGRTLDVGRADRLMRLLGVLNLGLVLARRGRQVVGAVGALHMLADRGDRLARHLHAVGAHICDQADGLAVEFHAFVKLLRHAHRLLCAEA